MMLIKHTHDHTTQSVTANVTLGKGFQSSVTSESLFSTGNQESPHGPILRGDTQPGVNGPNVQCRRVKHAPLQLYGSNPDGVHHPDMHEKMSGGNKSR